MCNYLPPLARKFCPRFWEQLGVREPVPTSLCYVPWRCGLMRPVVERSKVFVFRLDVEYLTKSSNGYSAKSVRPPTRTQPNHNKGDNW
ncbi:hypothetical protein VNO78_08090 [Psophocarpus tetragonolobus]|uniref:Uncharacterized protein n=1 Tax=Psophocarpus tetragonolobus TaxID=3891 RepID=A0AAN9XT14_PSOTE